MTVDYSYLRLRAYKGAPLAIMLYLWSTGEEVVRQVIERKTAYTDKTTQQALERLRDDYGVVEEADGRWRIAGHLPGIPEPARELLSAIDLPSYKNAPLAVLVCLLLAGRPANQEYIERTTGYTDKPISQALLLLQEDGLLSHTRAGWQLAMHAQQLPLSADALEPSRKFSEPALGAGVGNSPSTDQDRGKCIDLVAKNAGPSGGKGPDARRISDSPENFRLAEGSSSSSSNLINLNILTTTTTTPAPESEKFRESEIFRLNLAECRRWGIGMSTSRQLAALEHVTPRLIRAHCTTSEAGRPIKIGQAIARIRDDWGIPEAWLDPDAPVVVELPEEPEEPEEPRADRRQLESAPPAEILDEPWQGVIGQLRLEMGRGQFDAFVRDLAPRACTDAVFEVAAINDYAAGWVRDRLGKTITNLLTPQIGRQVALNLVVDEPYCRSWAVTHHL